MKPQNYLITISEPCHEDWDKMLPDAKGKFCNSCNKAVYDFTTKTDSEIQTILKENIGNQLCGHVKKTQLHRPLQISVPMYMMPQNVSVYNTFAIACFFVFGTMLFSCTDKHNQKIDTIEVTEQIPIMGAKMPLMPNDEVIDTTIVEDKVDFNEYITGDVNYENVINVIDSVINVPENDKYTTCISYESTVSGGMSFYQISDYVVKDSIIDNTEQKTNLINEIKEIKNELTVYPNPSNGNFNISYEIKNQTNVMIEIYDINGLRVRTIVNQLNQYAGKYIIPTNLSNLINGTYICRMILGDEIKSTKIVILN